MIDDYLTKEELMRVFLPVVKLRLVIHQVRDSSAGKLRTMNYLKHYD
jgi:hypothetical protein